MVEGKPEVVETIPWNQELIGEFFLSAFDEPVEVKSTSDDLLPGEKIDPKKLFYEERLNDQFTLQAALTPGSTGKITIQIEDSLGGPVPAVFDFLLEADGYDCFHRLVTTKQQGVSGTSLWQKTEKIFAYLYQTGSLEPKPFLLSSPNMEVIRWAEQNGFKFANNDNKKIWDDAQSDNDRYMTFSPKSYYAHQGIQPGKYIAEIAEVQKKRLKDRSFGDDISDVSSVAIHFYVTKEPPNSEVLNK